jgi:hypothetical protein
LGSRAIVLGGLTALVLMAFGMGTVLAADYQDVKGNVCEGTFHVGGCSEWGTHVTGSDNVALGDGMMPLLKKGSGNVALSPGALGGNHEGNDNIALGVNALSENLTGSNNVALGLDALVSNEGSNNVATGSEALFHNTTGEYNVASGLKALFNNKAGFDNIAFGAEALFSNTEGHRNLASGFEALFANTTGNENVADGVLALAKNTTGSANVALGGSAGKNLTTGSRNVDVANEGVEAEEGTTRIGTEGKQTKAFIAGIFPTEVSGCFVQVTKEGQLGCNPTGEAKEGKEGKQGAPGAEGKEGKEGKQGAPGAEGKEGKEGKTGATGPAGPAGNAAIATFASFEDVPSGHCLNYTDIGDPGAASCPVKTTGFSSGHLLAGPTPANGATVSNMYVDSNAKVSGKDTALVTVIDNTTGATLLSCTVESTNKNSCSNTGTSGLVAAGDNIEVKLTATGSSGNYKDWRVRFRY